MERSERGAALSIAFMSALVGGILSYAMLILAVSGARQAKFYRTRMPARYAAEAGMIWAQENLYDTPTWPGGTLTLTVGGNPIDVVVTVTGPAGGAQTIQTSVVY